MDEDQDMHTFEPESDQQDDNTEDIPEKEPETEEVRKERILQYKAQRKYNRAMKSILLRDNVLPKNSVNCLEQLHPDLAYNIILSDGSQIGNFMCSVEVNGDSFTGYGSSRDQSKRAAAEVALMSLVQPPPPKPAPGTDPLPDDDGDTTPWEAIGSYAMYKLLTNWNIINDPELIAYGCPEDLYYPPMMPQEPVYETPGENAGDVAPAPKAENLLDGEDPPPPGEEDPVAAVPPPPPPHSNIVPSNDRRMPQPIKISKWKSEKLTQGHPVMIFHQLCPMVSYEVATVKESGKRKFFRVTTYVNGQVFTGEDPNLRKAKMRLAKSALKSLYDIENLYSGC